MSPMHKIFYLSITILYKYFENNYVLPVMFWVMFLPVVFVDIFIFAYLLKLLLMQPHYSVGILLGMCPSVLFKNVRGL